jgi:hypothetical protein
LVALLLLIAGVSVGAQAAVSPSSAHMNRRLVVDLSAARTGAAPPLVFGIYPGGGVGTVGPAGATQPEDAAKRLEALERLRTPGRAFVLHLYAGYSGLASPSAAEQVGEEIAQYTAAGFQVELVLTYRPAGGSRAGNVAGFVDFVRSTVRSFGANPAFVGVQVTNEANVRNAPDAADGYYAGAQDALIRGVVAAKAEVRSAGYAQIGVGFNWAYSLDAGEPAFWRALGQLGGSAFRDSLDWVGLDVYPGTWGPTLSGDVPTAAAKTINDALEALRARFMPLAKLPPRIPLHVSENGYPTGPSRSEAMQAAVMRAAIAAVDASRSTYHVTDYRWFDLRDADSSGTSFEGRYGLMHDDYTPKAAFGVYRDIVATLGVSSRGQR